MEINSDVAAYAVVFFVAIPFCTLVHELGHALAALLFTDREVELNLGTTGPKIGARFGRLEFTLRLGPTIFLGSCRAKKDSPAASLDLLIILGGPLASAVATAFFAVLALTLPWLTPLWAILAIQNSLVALATGIAWTYPSWSQPTTGVPSDAKLFWFKVLNEKIIEGFASSEEREGWEQLRETLLENTGAKAETRKSFRAPMALNVSFDRDDEAIEVVADSFSGGGFGMVHDGNYVIGQHLNVRLQLPRQLTSVEATARVAWTRDGRVGLELIDLSNELSQRMDALAWAEYESNDE